MTFSSLHAEIAATDIAACRAGWHCRRLPGLTGSAGTQAGRIQAAQVGLLPPATDRQGVLLLHPCGTPLARPRAGPCQRGHSGRTSALGARQLWA